MINDVTLFFATKMKNQKRQEVTPVELQPQLTYSILKTDIFSFNYVSIYFVHMPNLHKKITPD